MAGLGTWALSDALEVEKPPKLSTVTATVKRVDDDGTAWVTLGDGAGEFPATGNTAEVKPGDRVSVRIQDGTATIGGNVSDPSAGITRVMLVENLARDTAEESARTAQAVVDAQQTADEANKVAQATNQHFFADTNGAHITDVTQDEWAQAVADNFSDYDPDTKPYHNQLLNSLGILLRTALNNLVSITRSAIAFYDGAGNAASNIVARFGSDGAQIGKSSAAHSVIDADGQRFYGGTNGATQLANIGYGEGASATGTANAPYYTFGTRDANAAIGNYSVAEGRNVEASGYNSHAEGHWTHATEVYCHAEGSQTTASRPDAHAEGGLTTASGDASHSEGSNTTASGSASHAEGWHSTASGVNAHAEGSQATASGNFSHAECSSTYASGNFSHAEGNNTTASGKASHSQNDHTVAQGDYQTAIGTCNEIDYNNKYAFIIGNGDWATNVRSNALAVKWDGTLETAQDIPWTELTLASGWTAYSTARTPMYRRVGSMVEVRGAVKPTAETSLGTSSVTFGNLPPGCRPVNMEVTAICQGSGVKEWLFTVDTDGNVCASRMRTMNSTAYQSAGTSEFMVFDVSFLAG